LAQSLYYGIDAVVEFDYGPVGPKSLPYFLARNHVAGVLQQHRQHLKGLVRNLYLLAVSTQLSCI
jgi:hypothetical protein